MRVEPNWLSEALCQLDGSHLLREKREVELLVGGRCRIGSRNLLDFSSNNYLDLARDPDVLAAAAEAVEAGLGAGASPLVTGRSPHYRLLEETLAEFEGTPSALLFPTGFAANLGTVPALVGRDDTVFSDRDNHASLIDGCRLSRARIHVYDRNRLEDLDAALASSPRQHRRLIVTDGVFSMEGQLAPLADLCELADAHEAMFLVDEAHATGVLGETGRGSCQWHGVEDRVTFRVGTLSKAIGSSGGFVAASVNWIKYLWNTARTQIFSTALSPASCAAAIEALRLIVAEPGRRQMLSQRGTQLRSHLASLGVAGVLDGTGPIVPIILHEPETCLSVARKLFADGFLVGAIRPPTVPVGTARLRISLSSGHTEDDVAQLAKAVAIALPAGSALRD